MTGLLVELCSRIGVENLPLIERWDSDVFAVGCLDSRGGPRLVFVTLSPWARERYDVTLDPGPGYFAARDVDQVERLVRMHLRLEDAASGPASAA
jgi:hypothetical protein